MKTAISIVLGSYNRKKFLKLTIESIRREIDRCKLPCEIIVIDGGSTDGSIKWLTKQKDIISIIQHNRGIWRGKPIERRSWGYFMNLGFKAAQGKYVCMISDDCLIVPNAIKKGYEHFEKELKKDNKIGAMAFYWRNWPEQTRYWVGKTLGDKMFVNHGMYLKSALEDVGYIDEETYLFYHADGDLCLKLWHAGYRCIESPDSYIEHFSHASFEVRKGNNQKQQQDWCNYLSKWKNIYHHPGQDDIGCWIEKEYADKHNTTKMFKMVAPMTYIKIKVMPVLGKVKKSILNPFTKKNE